jgi:S1-C subfamily serine protease
MSDLLNLSNALSTLAADVAPRIIAVEGADGRQVSGFIWGTGLAVAAHEALEGEEEAQILRADGSLLKAQIAGRDPSTDVALSSSIPASSAIGRSLNRYCPARSR